MIAFYNLDVCVGHPVEIFEAPTDMSLKELLDRLGLEKGAGGAPLGFVTPQKRDEYEQFPSSLLLQRNSIGKLVTVGTLAPVYAECRDFAVLTSNQVLVERACSFATHLAHYDYDRQVDYANIVLARDDDAPS